MRDFINNKLFRKILIIYTLILVVPISVMFNLYSFKNYKTENINSIKESQRKTAAIAGIVDAELRNFYKLSNQISLLDWLVYIQSNSETLSAEYSKSVMKRSEIIKQLSIFQTNIGINSKLGILLKQKHVIISGQFWGPEELYFYDVLPINKDEQNKFLSALREGGKFELLSWDQLGIKTYDKSLILISDLEMYSPSKAVLFMLIKASSFNEMLEKVDLGEILQFKILQKGEVIHLYEASNEKINQKDLYTTTIPSLWNNLEYEITIKLRQLPVSITILRNILIIVLISSLGIVLGYFLAMNSYKPVLRILKKVSANGEKYNYKRIPFSLRFSNVRKKQKLPIIKSRKTFIKNDEFDLIEQSFDKLENEKNELRCLTIDYLNVIQNNYLQNLLLGYIDNIKTEIPIKKFGITFKNGDSHIVVDISTVKFLMEEDNEGLLGTCIKEYLEKQNLSFELFINNNNNIIIIFRINPDEGDIVVAQMILLQKYVESNLGMRICAICGSVEKGIIGISKSYESTKQTNRNEKEEGLFYARTIESRHHYPFDWEFNILNSIKAGEKDAVRNILREIRIENKKRKLPQYMNVKLFYLIFETLIGVSSKLDLEVKSVESTFFELIKAYDEEQIWNTLNAIALDICSKVIELSENTPLAIRMQIMDYIDKHYLWSGLSLKVISGVFNFSISRISRIVKQSTKINFVDYLHWKRINKAKEYFSNGEDDTMDICIRVGFESQSTFKRAFIKFEGVTPTQYIRKSKQLLPNINKV